MKSLAWLLIPIILFVISCDQQNADQEESKPEYVITSIEGFALGTTYLIKYVNIKDSDYSEEITALLDKFENSMSTYRENSVISRINRNDSSVFIDNYFIECFNKAMEVSKNTGGAFDMTVAPLVNAWGFGFTEKTEVDKEVVDSILNFVGFNKIRLENKKVIKDDPGVMLDASAIAKGQCVDIVSNYLISSGIENFLVEIGGEVFAKGMKKEDQNWIIGIDKPVDNSTINNRELQETVKLKDKALATSGNYRQFYIKDGVRYSHTINPKTGYPVDHDLLSVTVLADDCMTADAYATAFMVLGYEKSIDIINSDSSLHAYFILSGENEQYRVAYSDDFEKLIYQK